MGPNIKCDFVFIYTYLEDYMFLMLKKERTAVSKVNTKLTPKHSPVSFYKKSIYFKGFFFFFFASEIEAHSKATVQCSENISVML